MEEYSKELRERTCLNIDGDEGLAIYDPEYDGDAVIFSDKYTEPER